jgi:hypothetical protein
MLNVFKSLRCFVQDGVRWMLKNILISINYALDLNRQNGWFKGEEKPPSMQILTKQKCCCQFFLTFRVPYTFNCHSSFTHIVLGPDSWVRSMRKRCSDKFCSRQSSASVFYLFVLPFHNTIICIEEATISLTNAVYYFNISYTQCAVR